jgi:WD40 repeat protein
LHDQVYCTITKAILHDTSSTARVKSVSMSQDGRRICFGGWSQTVHVQGLQDGVDSTSIDWSHRGTVRTVAMSRDARYIVVAGDLTNGSETNGCAMVYAIGDGSTVLQVRRKDPVWGVSIGRYHGEYYLAAAGYDGLLGIYVIPDKQVGQEWDSVRSAVARRGSDVLQAKLEAAKKQRLIQAQVLAQAGISASPSTAASPIISIREPFGSRKPLCFIWTVEFSADASRLAVGCWNGAAVLYSMDDLLEVAAAGIAKDCHSLAQAAKAASAAQLPEPAPLRLYKRSDRVYSVALNAKGTRMAVGGRDKAVAVYNCESETESILFHVNHGDFVYSCAIHEDKLAVGGVAKAVKVYDYASGVLCVSFECRDAVWGLSFDDDGEHLAIASADRTARVLDLQSKKVIIALPQPQPVFAIFIANGCMAYTTGKLVQHMGIGSHYTQKPGMDVVQSLLSDASAFEMVLTAHPSILNFYDPIDRRSFLKDLCTYHNTDMIKFTLEHAKANNLTIRLHPESQVSVLLELAAFTVDRELVQLILELCCRCPPRSRHLLTRCIAELVAPDGFPELALNWLQELPLEATPFSYLPRAAGSLAILSPRRSSSFSFWGKSSAKLGEVRRKAFRSTRNSGASKVQADPGAAISRRSSTKNAHGHTHQQLGNLRRSWWVCEHDAETGESLKEDLVPTSNRGTPWKNTAVRIMQILGLPWIKLPWYEIERYMLPLSRNKQAFAAVKQVFLPGMCSKVVLTAMLDSGKIDTFENCCMENSLQAAWNLYGRHWYFHEALKRVYLLAACCVYSYLLWIEHQVAPGGSQCESGAMAAETDWLVVWESSFSAKASLCMDCASLLACAWQLKRIFVPKERVPQAKPMTGSARRMSSMNVNHGMFSTGHFQSAHGPCGWVARTWVRAGKEARRTFHRVAAEQATLVTVLLVAATCASHLLRFRHVHSTAGVTVVFVWFKSAFVFRGVRSTGLLVRMLEHISAKILAFVIILLFVIFAFTHSFWLLFMNVMPPAQAIACADETAVANVTAVTALANVTRRRLIGKGSSSDPVGVVNTAGVPDLQNEIVNKQVWRLQPRWWAGVLTAISPLICRAMPKYTARACLSSK